MKNTFNYPWLCFAALVLNACSDTSERYRDIHALELPPELVIKHTHTESSITYDDLTAKPKSPLADLVDFKDDGVKPVLTLKTRADRAWDMVAVAIKISNIKVIDKNREQNRIQVRFDPDTAGKEESLLDIFSDDNYAEADYNLTLKEEILGVVVNAALVDPSQLEFGEDGSAELIRFLHKVIDEKIINRDRTKSEE